jgi:hypothetical protein
MDINYVLRAHGLLGGKSKDEVAPLPITNFQVVSVGDGFVELSWTNPPSEDTDFVGVKIQRKIGSYPVSENDGETIYDGTIPSVIDSGLTNGVIYYYRAFTYDFDNNFNADTGQQVSGVSSAYDDTSGSPGSKNLIGGDMNAGYFGTVSSSELITGDQLASEIGLSAGASQHSTTNWLKFAYNGKILFTPMKPIRYGLSWDEINTIGAVSGMSTVNIKGLTYKARLFRGAEHNPTNSYNDLDKDSIGSEWNDLMYPIHEHAATSNWTYPEHVGINVQNWGIGFTDDALLTHAHYGNGSYSLCQEESDTNTQKIARGGQGVSNVYMYHANSDNSNVGWRPVLELVE